MSEDLHRLRLAVDEATVQLIAADRDLEAARAVEREAADERTAMEKIRAAALARLNEARAALDARLGIGPVLRPVPATARVVSVVEAYGDDDDPVR